MTLEEARQRWPKRVRAYEEAKRHGVCEAARRLGVVQSCVSSHAILVRKALRGDFDVTKAQAERALAVQREAPSAWRAYQLRVIERMPLAEVAVTLGVSKSCVSHHVATAARLLTKDQPAPKPKREPVDLTEVNRLAGARCRCGLLRPCLRCLPTIDEAAGSRRGDASGLT